MKTILIYLILTALIFPSCNSKTNQTSEPQQQAKYNQATSNTPFPYRYINNKREVRENDGSYNEMTLYVCGKHLNADTLKMFCKLKKDSISDGIFHIITFFDNKKYAKFTKYPITSMYGLDEEPAKHIKAEYTYNASNGFSKLTIYEKNSWESKAKEFDIN